MKVIRLVVMMSLIGVLGFFAHQTHTEPQVRHNSLAHRLSHPTDLRVRYRIGEVDARFGLSRDEVRYLAYEAAMIWQNGTDRQWFVYDDDAKVSINLIYDERQMETNTRQKIKHELHEMQSRHQRNTDNLEMQRQQLSHEFHELQNTLNTWQKQYNHTMQLLNHTRDDHQRQQLLQKERELLAEQQHLNAKIERYHALQQAFNQAVDSINHEVGNINHAVNRANAYLTPREFHKGQFDGRRIDIYEFENKDELRLVLAHEMGHALSIGHHDDPTALMYPYAGEQALEGFRLKQSDIALLDNRQLYR